MATYQEVQDRINLDYLNRTDLSAETTRAIAASIRRHERRRFFFNESSTALATVAAQSHIATPTAFFSYDYLRIFYAASASYELNRVEMDDLLDMRAGALATGLPTHYAIYGERFELFPIPTSAWTVTAHGVHQIAAVSSAGATNAWYSAAEDLVVYGACKIMWSNVLRNSDEAMKYAGLERDSLSELDGLTERQLMHAIRATRF